MIGWLNFRIQLKLMLGAKKCWFLVSTIRAFFVCKLNFSSVKGFGPL